MSQLNTLEFRLDIQGLRGIAILLVVLGHASLPGFNGGFVGVDVFFVLSGYLISGLLLQEWHSTGHIHIADFLSRRLRRLLPALIVVLLATLMSAEALLSTMEARAQSHSLVYAATWTSNLYFALDTLDYFAELEAKDLFLHTWSLGVEEQFYLLWPLLLLLLFKTIGSDNRGLLQALAIIAAGSLGLCWYWSASNPMWAFYLMPSRIWQFALGAGVFIWRQEYGVLRSGVVPLLGLALILASGMLLHPALNYPGVWALLPSLGTAALLLGDQQHEQLRHWLGHPILVWLGDRSYSWYLWHWPVLLLGEALGARGGFAMLALIGLSILLAAVSYRWVELPFWRGRLGATSPLRINLSAILAILTLIAARPLLQPSLSPSASSAVSLTGIDKPIIYTMDCDSWYMNATVQPCYIGDPDAPRTAVLLGDSIGAQWFSLLPDIFTPPEWHIVVLTKSSCPIIDEDFFYQVIGQTYTVCREWREEVLIWLAQQQPDVLMFGSAATYPFSAEQWLEGSSRILARLSTAANQVILIPGTPPLSFHGPACLMRGTNGIGTAECQEIANPQANQVSQLLAQAAQRFDNVTLLDLNPKVCPEDRCAARNTDGVIVFRDTQHLTDTFVRGQIPWVQQQFQQRGLIPIVSAQTAH